MGEQAQGGTRSSRGTPGHIWGFLLLYSSIPLPGDVWEKRGDMVW